MDLNKLRKRDLEQLSAYLDGELNEKDSRWIEVRIQSDSQLRFALQELENTRQLVSELPAVRPPRNFTLTPEMAGIQRGLNLFPIFRLATVIAAVAFAILVGADTLFLRGSGDVPLAVRPVQMLVEEELESAAVEEPVEGMLEAPMEDAVVGSATAEVSQDEEDLAAPEAMQAPTDEIQTEREPGFQGFGTETDQGLVGEETKAQPTESLPAEATEVGEADIATEEAEESMEAPMVVEPTTTPFAQPTLEPLVPEVSRPTVDPLRVVEIGLGALVVLSAAITWILRRAR